MECPKFSNYIAVTNNNTTDEFVLNFFHDFPVIDGTVEDEKIKLSVSRAHVCGVVLRKDMAEQLYNMLGKHLAKGEGNE